jgi:hypothetical protein
MRPSPDHDIAAAKALAERLGLGVVEPQVLKLAHHTTLKLGAAPIVARILSGEPAAAPRMAGEVALGRSLANAGAPVVAPTRNPRPGPYVEPGCIVTLWDFVDHRRADETRDALAAAEALKAVHAALAALDDALPPFTDGLAACANRLADRAAMVALGERDRGFLEDRVEALRAELGTPDAGWRPLHGDTHLGNVLMTPRGPAWCDLETACRGPLEWDLVQLPPAARRVFGPVDEGLLERLSELRSVTVAVWCWADADRSPEVREAAEYHLARAKRLARR